MRLSEYRGAPGHGNTRPHHLVHAALGSACGLLNRENHLGHLASISARLRAASSFMTGDSLLCGEGFLGVLPSSSSHNRSPTLGVEVLEARFHNYFPPLQSGKKAWLEFHLGLSLGRLRDLAYIKPFQKPVSCALLPFSPSVLSSTVSLCATAIRLRLPFVNMVRSRGHNMTFKLATSLQYFEV